MAAVEDVTANLPSLQFEAALTDQEKYTLFRKTACYFLKTLFASCLDFFRRELLYLRGRSHALTVSACAQA